MSAKGGNLESSVEQNYAYVFQRDLLRDKVAFVTGGGSGIGFTITEILMRHGCNAVIASRDLNRLQRAAKKLEDATGRKCLPIKMDVRKPQEIVEAVDLTMQTFKKIDILVNSAAGNFLCPASSLSFNGFKTVMDIDANGTFYASKAVYDKCMKNHGGVIVNITATLHYKGQVFQTHAGSAKAAIDAMTKHLACEWGRDKVRVVSVAPGPIADTLGFNKLGGNAPGAAARFMDIPLQRVGEKVEIANAVVYLVSDAASWITGICLVVDGGAWLSSANSFNYAMQAMKAQQSKL
ncbi:peroxisomal 2,4-dienoyl-CoA reductase [Lingula anatina]|uniref:Peroxisomal 2,4-dienoyl-CoA reductase [(3E)-enoyl-CoA-producing] n=1 Tax=Lingula anatina TaxID=7574 RepID=A0A1S3JWN1_LINAN|nr:peroxisomal 2,4-dienoyl-CoA reductase [Lingula anatina]|eukprot:XP_013414835.1 peroxisomal 2,4-dienoyl-CoA reductase [Lingula anatina]